MTRGAIGDKITQSVGTFPVILKVTPGYSVMNVQRLADGILSDTAPLASIAVSLSGFCGLLLPVRATVIGVSSQPNRIISPSAITRCSLPSGAAFNAAKVALVQLRRASIKLYTAGVTRHGHAGVLRMIGPGWGILTLPSVPAFLITEVMFKTLCPALLMNGRFSTVVAGQCYSLRSGSVPAGKRAILLFGVAAWRLKRLLAMLARFGEVLSPGFVGTGNRTELDGSICALFDWLLAVFA